MWNSFLDMAEKAKKAAAELDQQLNESVGVSAATPAAGEGSVNDDDVNNIWGDDDDVDVEDVVDDDVMMEPLEEGDEENAGNGWEEDEIGDFSNVGDSIEDEENIMTPPVVTTVQSLQENDDAQDVVVEPLKDEADVDEHENDVVQEVTDNVAVSDSFPAKDTGEQSCEVESHTVLPPAESKEEPVDADVAPTNEPVGGSKEDGSTADVFEDVETKSAQETEFDPTPPLQPSANLNEDNPTSQQHSERDAVTGTVESNREEETSTPDVATTEINNTESILSNTASNDTEEGGEGSTPNAAVASTDHVPQNAPRVSAQSAPAPGANSAKIIRQLKSQLAAARQQRDQDRNKFSQRLAASQQQAKQATETADALRHEGERLAKSQSVMETAVRTAKGELRGVQEELEASQRTCEEQELKIISLEEAIQNLTNELSEATALASTAGQLQADLVQSRDESERRATTIRGLEQQLKELKFMVRDVTEQLDTTQQESATETATVQKELKLQHATAMAELQQQFETSAREAAEREDDLREQVDTLRKQWQEAVRRADALSVEAAQASTPKLYQQQLELTNQQYRARVAAAATREEELRQELDQATETIAVLRKEKDDHKATASTLESSLQSQTSKVERVQKDFEDQAETCSRMEAELLALREDVKRMRVELSEAERQAETCGLRVRGEMSQTLLDSETRHASQLQSLEVELRDERTLRRELEEELKAVRAQNSSNGELLSSSATPHVEQPKRPPPKLRKSEGQAAILAGALGGFGMDEADDEEDDFDIVVEESHQATGGPLSNGGGSSYAALEELTAKLRSAKAELDTLRKRLETSESTRQELLDRLAESRHAREQLPLLETQVAELSVENKDLSLEVQGLRADIVDVQELYRSQLNALLEAQASSSLQTEGLLHTASNANSDGDTSESKCETGAPPRAMESISGD